MNYIFSLLTLFFTFKGLSQEINKPLPFDHFTQFEVSIPLQGNKNRGEIYPDGRTNNSWFVPDGINANFGYGIHFNKWLGIVAAGNDTAVIVAQYHDGYLRQVWPEYSLTTGVEAVAVD